MSDSHKRYCASATRLHALAFRTESFQTEPFGKVPILAVVTTALLLIVATASAEVCAQPQTLCENVFSIGCDSDCDSRACWSIDTPCTFEGAIPLAPSCG